MKEIPRDRQYQRDLDTIVDDFRVICSGAQNQTVFHAIARFLCGFALNPDLFDGNFTLEQRIDKVTALIRKIMTAEATEI